MKQSIGLLILLSLMISFHVSAQDATPQYRLRTPSAEEYLAQLPDFSALELWGHENQTQAALLITAAEVEFLNRYEAIADFDLLSNAYDKFSIGIYSRPGSGDGYPVLDLNEWNARLIEAWLLEHPTEFEGLQRFQFADYNITIEPRDFTGDGVHEWLLDVTKGSDQIIYHNYLVAFRNGEGYQILTVPITWSADGFSSESSEGNPVSESRFEDITADGVPEWVLGRAGSSVGPGYAFYYGYMYIFTWRETHFERLLVLHNGASIENVDADEPLELVRVERHFDNWGCGYNNSIIFDWDGQNFVEQAPQVEWFDCTARHAEEAMWTGDFVTAAALYDEFISAHASEYATVPVCWQGESYPCHTRNTIILQYFLVRRVIVYALLNQTSRVAELLVELRDYDLQYSFAQSILDANSTDARILCQTAYDFYSGFIPAPGDYSEERMLTFIPGDIIENVELGWDYFLGRQINPARAGCDIDALNGTPMPTLSPTSTPYFYPSPTPDARPQAAIWIDTQDAYEAFRASDFETVLTITQAPVVQDDFQAAELHYYRALALEALNRPDEALAAYIAVYTAAPDSAWGQLAALHLEPI